MSWAEELDLMNTETQATFGDDITIERVSKSALNTSTGARTVTPVGSVTVKAIPSEVRKVPYSPGGGRTQHTVEVVYEILCSALQNADTGDTEPYAPIRKGDRIKDANLDVPSASGGDGNEQMLVVDTVERSVDRRFWRVTARGEEAF